MDILVDYRDRGECSVSLHATDTEIRPAMLGQTGLQADLGGGVTAGRRCWAYAVLDKLEVGAGGYLAMVTHTKLSRCEGGREGGVLATYG